MTKKKLTNPEKMATEMANSLAARLHDQIYDVAQAFPNMTNNLFFPPEDFRGLNIVISKRGGYLAVAKRFHQNGDAEIMFAHGDTPFEALMEMEAKIGKPNWRADTPPKNK